MKNSAQLAFGFPQRVCHHCQHHHSDDREGGTVEGEDGTKHQFETFKCEDCARFSLAYCVEALDPAYALRFDGDYGLGTTRCIDCWIAREYRQNHQGEK